MQNQKISKYLNLALTIVLYLILFIPLLLNSRFIFPFITGKTMFFRLAVELAIILYSALAMISPQFRPRMTKLSWLIIAFGGIILLTGITGVDFYKSFWGTIERGEGFLTISHLIIYFLLLTWTFKSKKEIINYITAAVCVGLLVDLYAILQRMQVEKFLFWRIIHSGEGRLSATIGNAAFMGAFSLAQFFLSLLLFLKRKALVWKIAGFVAILFNLYLLYETQTRGAAIGLVVVVFLISIFYFFKSPDKIKKKVAGIILLIVILSISLIWANKDSSFVQSSPMLYRLVSISRTDITTESRLSAWNTSWNGWKDRFIFGYGWENYNVAFNKYFPAIIYKDAGSQLWFDRAHNTIFDIAVATGILGLICYIMIFGLAIYYLFKNIKYDFDFSIILIALLIAHFIQNIFVFDVLSTFILLFLVLATVTIQHLEKTNHIQEENLLKPEFNVLTFAIVLIFVVFSAFIFNIKPMQANIRGIQGLVAFRLNNINSAVDIFQQTFDMKTYQTPELRQKLGDNILLYNKIGKNLSKDDVNKNFIKTIEILKDNIKEHPYDVQNYMYLMAILNKAVYASQNLAYLDQIIELGKESLKLSPTRPQIYFEMGQAEVTRKNYTAAEKYFQKGVDLNPETLESHLNLLNLYILSKQYEKADDKYNWMKEKDFPFETPNNLNRLYNVYMLVDNKPKMVEVLEQLVNVQPNGDNYARLAAVYKEVGDYNKALDAVQKAVELDPSLKDEAEIFIQLLNQ